MLSVTLPWISSELHAHAKGHWRSKAAATKACREMAFLVGKSLRPKMPYANAKVFYRFYVPDKRRRDEANMVQAVKPFLDGLVDAGVIAGDDWTVLNTKGIAVAVDRDNPRVVLEFEEMK
jgi:crossover junction endodeoxyribonuclease RusA